MSDTMKLILSWMGILGIPSIFAMTSWSIRKCNSFGKQMRILMKAQQAQMRSQLLQQYHQFEAQGYVSEDDLCDWENQYQSYHALGSNGILDRRREQLFNMPNSPQ